MEEEKTIKEEIKELKELVKENKKSTVKKFRVPTKAKLNQRKIREGYVSVVVINENRNIDFTKEQIKDSTIKLNDTFHAVDESAIYFYKGKPFIFLPKTKLNPYDPLEGKNETYGQKYVMARMEGDKITTKKKIGWGLSIGVLVVVGVIIYALVTGGN